MGKTRTATMGVSIGSVLTGLVVAFGAMLLFGIIGAALAVAIGMRPADIQDVSPSLGIWFMAAALIVQFLSYMWGGYTAGRMGRASGALNGSLVAAGGLLVGVLTGLVTVAFGGIDPGAVPSPYDPPFGGSDLVRIGTLMGLGSLAVMFAGATIGGVRGERWHRAVETTAVEPTDRVIDVRDRTLAGAPTHR